MARDEETNRELPPPRSFPVELAEMRKGEVAAELSEEWQRIIIACNNAAKKGRRGKGELRIVLKLEVDESGAATVGYDFSGKVPKPVHGSASFYVDPVAGALVRMDPRQQEMPFREIPGGKAESKEAPARAVKGG